MIARFGDPERGGFFSTSDDHEELIARRKEIGDHPIPSGNSSAALGLLRLGGADRRARATSARRRASSGSSPGPRPVTPTPSPTSCGRSTSTSPRPRRSPSSATTSASWPRVVRTSFRPHLVLAGGEGTSSPPLLAERPAVDGRPAAYVCENFACRAPVTEAEELSALL